jgi:probable selenium-dependent hydroxylase accessory protein YqeC
MDADQVFRMDRFERVTGASRGSPLTASIVSRLFEHSAGLFRGAPEGARRTAFLNKTDLVADPAEARLLVRRILESREARVGSVILGSLREGRYHTEERA